MGFRGRRRAGSPGLKCTRPYRDNAPDLSSKRQGYLIKERATGHLEPSILILYIKTALSSVFDLQCVFFLIIGWACAQICGYGCIKPIDSNGLINAFACICATCKDDLDHNVHSHCSIEL